MLEASILVVSGGYSLWTGLMTECRTSKSVLLLNYLPITIGIISLIVGLNTIYAWANPGL